MATLFSLGKPNMVSTRDYAAYYIMYTRPCYKEHRIVVCAHLLELGLTVRICFKDCI